MTQEIGDFVDTINAFGETLKKVRILNGLSQTELAARCSLDRTFISMLERGQRQPTLTTLFSLASAFRMQPSELVEATEKRMRRARFSRSVL